MISKKSISPVVAIALLLVTSVVSVVGYQIWFSSYSSSIFTNVESTSTNSVSAVYIEDKIFSNFIYINNKNLNSIKISEIKVNGNNCYVSGEYGEGNNEVLISDCTQQGNNEIVVFTDAGVISKKVYVSNKKIYSSPCPTGYILVPGNSFFGTKNFCVMKYEAKFKNISGKSKDVTFGGYKWSSATGDMEVTSSAEITPIVNINQTDAILACSNLGSKYHLITNGEWMSIARNIEQQALNWNSSEVGSGFIYSGHNDFTPLSIFNSSSNDSNGYYLTGDTLGSNQKRTLFLSNGEVIWDFAGNVEESIDSVCGDLSNWHSPGNLEWSNSNLSGYEKVNYGPLGNYNSVNGIGKYNSCSDELYVNFRGGSVIDTSLSGIYKITSAIKSVNILFLGFRCAYTP